MRTVDPGGDLMFDVSMNGSDGDHSGSSEDAIQRATAREVTEIFDFLIHVGISRNLISDILFDGEPAPGRRSGWYCPSSEELRRYNVTPIVASFQTQQPPVPAGDEKR